MVYQVSWAGGDILLGFSPSSLSCKDQVSRDILWVDRWLGLPEIFIGISDKFCSNFFLSGKYSWIVDKFHVVFVM